jgi:hypothetical protein
MVFYRIDMNTLPFNSNAARDQLRSGVNYDEGRKLRLKLKEHAKAYYVSNHTSSQYVDFMNEHECTFSVNGNQSTNHPYYWSLFTVASQHVMGDCVEECFDVAMKCIEAGLSWYGGKLPAPTRKSE